MKNLPIGIFDSGVGGISVLKELKKIMPNENYIYYGDSANAPYGNKTTDEVRELSKNAFLKLTDMGVKAVVIACNTATSAAAGFLRNLYPDMPIIGLEPAIKPAILNKKDSVIIVMATPVTLREEKFHKLAAIYEHLGEIIPLPCDRLAALIEEGKTDSEETLEYIKELFAPYKNFDSVVLGCTHYPLIRPLIEKVIGEKPIFDGGQGAAKETMRRLSEKNLLNSCGGDIKFISSRDTQKLIEFAKKYI